MKLNFFKKTQKKSKNNSNKLRSPAILSIKIRMIALMSILLLVVCVGLSVVSYLNSSKALIDQVEGTLPLVAEQSAQVLENRIGGNLIALGAIAARPEIGDPKTSISDKLLILKEESERGGHKWMGFIGKDGVLYSTDGNFSYATDKNYFTQSIKGEDIVTEPIINTSMNSALLVYSVPIKYDGEIVGVLAAARDGYELCDFVQDITYGKSGKAFIINEHGTTIAHIDRQKVFDRYNAFEQVEKDATLRSLVAIEEKMIKGESSTGEYKFEGIEMYLGYASLKDTGWSIAVEAPKSEVLEQLDSLKTSIITMSLVFVVLSLISTYFIASSISNPIKSSSEFLKNIATGDFTKEVSKKHLKRKDEFGILAKSIETMQNSIKDLVHDVINEASNVSSVINGAIENISDLNGQIEDVSATTEEVSAGMEEMAASAQEMNATSSEIDRAVESIAAKAQDGASAAGAISEKANKLKEDFLVSRKNAQEVFIEVKGKLENALEEAKAVEQINVLAEAILQITARAGEAGRGFAVVADEIRKLAENSSSTVAKIQDITQTVVQSVGNLSSSSNALLNYMATDVNRDYKTMLNATDEYNKDAQSIAELVTDFSATSEELAASMQNMIKAISEITDSNNEAAEGTQSIAQKTTIVAERSNNVLLQANSTKESADKLNAAVARFKV